MIKQSEGKRGQSKLVDIPLNFLTNFFASRFPAKWACPSRIVLLTALRSRGQSQLSDFFFNSKYLSLIHI